MLPTKEYEKEICIKQDFVNKINTVSLNLLWRNRFENINKENPEVNVNAMLKKKRIKSYILKKNKIICVCVLHTSAEC